MNEAALNTIQKEIEALRPANYDVNTGSHLSVSSACWIGADACRESLEIAQKAVAYKKRSYWERDCQRAKYTVYFDAAGNELAEVPDMDQEHVIRDYHYRLTGDRLHYNGYESIQMAEARAS